MKAILRILFVLLLVSCSPRGCIESQFTLAPESRMPKWFSLPAGHTRNDVTVTLTYYTPPSVKMDNAVLELKGKLGITFSQTSGEMCWHPAMAKKKNQYGGFDPDSYPHYVYIRANGIVEVIEHIWGPTFRVLDDPVLMRGAMEAQSCDRG